MKLDLQNTYKFIVNEIRERILMAEILSDSLDKIVFIESTSLQIRKILELIAYLSLLVNLEKLNHKARKEWHMACRENHKCISYKQLFFIPSLVI